MLLLALAGCSRCCDCSRAAHAVTDSPSDEVAKERLTTHLKSAREIASELCGIPAEGLRDVVVELTSRWMSVGAAHVTGNAIVAGDDAGPSVGKAVVCAGIVSFVLVATLDDKQEFRWRISEIDVDAVETAGVVFHLEEHHHHHHHHH